MNFKKLMLDELMSMPAYQNATKDLSDEDKKVVLSTVTSFFEKFSSGILEPLSASIQSDETIKEFRDTLAKKFALNDNGAGTTKTS